MRRWIAAWVIMAAGMVLLALNLGDVLAFQITIGALVINGPASLGSIMVILSTLVLLEFF